MLKKTVLTLAAIGGLVGAGSAPTIAADHVSIPFASSGGIDDWRPEGNRVVYLHSRGNDWYRAELFGPCDGLKFTETIGYVPSTNGSFDNTSSIVVDGKRCAVMKLEKSAEPAPKKKN